MEKVYTNDDGELVVTFGEEPEVIDAVLSNFKAYLEENQEGEENAAELREAIALLTKTRNLVARCLSGAPRV